MRFKTFIDLFCGIGGFRVALQNSGLSCVSSCDSNKRVRDAYFKNFNSLPMGDIFKLSPNYFKQHDVLCAGFPCQPFSVSGRRLGLEDKRGTVFFKIIEIAKHHQPKIILLENVLHLKIIEKGALLKKMMGLLESIGYTVHTSVLNASHFGVPQSRKRLYFVCLKKGENLKYNEPPPTYKKIFLSSILDKFPEKATKINQSHNVFIDRSKQPELLKPVRIGCINNKNYQGYRVYSTAGHAVTIMANGGGLGAKTGLYFTGTEVRALSVLEVKRVMGFPDNHYVDPVRTEALRQLGNAVIPKMVEVVYRGIYEQKRKSCSSFRKEKRTST